MLSKLLPVIFLLLGTGAGVGAGLFLHTPAAPAVDAEEQSDEDDFFAQAKHSEGEEEDETRDYVKLTNQFIVPIVADDEVKSMIVMSLSLETVPGMTEAVFAREPKLRDVFLRVLFDHANVGSFNGRFTDPGKLDVLRKSLLAVAQREMGADVTDVLIVDIARQDF